MLAFLFMLRGATVSVLCWQDVRCVSPHGLEVHLRSLIFSIQASTVVIRQLEQPLAPEVLQLWQHVLQLGVQPGDRELPCNLNNAVQTVLQLLHVQYQAKGHSAALSLGVPLERVSLHGVWAQGSIFRYVAVHVKVSPTTFSF